MPSTKIISRYYILLTPLSILLITFGHSFQEKVLIFHKHKLSKLILKKRKSRKKKKTLLIIPKLIIFLLTISEELNEKRKSAIDTIENNEIVLGCHSSLGNDALLQQYKLYALSELKYRNHETFCRFLLLLSGDIELNPGPDFSCVICKKSIPLRYRVLCCYNCDSWVHKKCAKISETKYKSIKMKETGYYFDCHRCNYAKEMPFFHEENLEENPEAVTLNEPNITDFEGFTTFEKRGLHFMHLNINSILPKIDELRLIAFKSHAAVIGITESKIDDTVLDGEIMIDGYIPIRSDRTRHGGGVICYIREDISFNKIELKSDIEHIFLDILLPNTKPILIGIIYRPPKQTSFLNNMSIALENIPNFNNRETYILGDININLLHSGLTVPMGIKKYRDFCSIQGLTQIINNATRITETTLTYLITY